MASVEIPILSVPLDRIRNQTAPDKNQPVADIQKMNAVVSASVSRPQFQSALLGTFAAIAWILACVGI